MPPACPQSIHIHKARITRLDATGAPDTSGTTPKNSIVTSALTHLNWTVNSQAGDQRVVVGGGDCICAQYRGQDKLLNLGLELEMCRLEAALMEMMLGTPLILGPLVAPATEAPIIGAQLGVTPSCGAVRTGVALEAWSTAWSGAGQLAGTPFIRWVFPMTYWQIGNGSLQNDFLLPTLTGYTQDNPEWGTGPYADDTVDPGPKVGWYLDSAMPDDTNCDYAVAA